jgi:hypothetical protein
MNKKKRLAKGSRTLARTKTSKIGYREFIRSVGLRRPSSSLLPQLRKAQGVLCHPLRKHLPIRGGISLGSRRRTTSESIGVVMVWMMFHASGTLVREVCLLLPQVHGLWE